MVAKSGPSLLIMDFPTVNDYFYNFQQISPIDWRIKIKTPNGVNMMGDLRCGPNPVSNEQVFELIKNPETRKQFTIELESEVIKEVIKEVVKEEIKQEITTPIATGEVLENPPLINN